MTVDANLQAAFQAVNDRIHEIKNSKQRLIFNPRVYLYTDKRWISVGDSSYGFEDVNATETSGTSTTPLIEWENQGVPFSKDDIIRNIELRQRVNSHVVDDLELYIVYIYPDAVSRWTAGFGNDSEISSSLLYNGLFLDRTGTENDLTSDLDDRSRQIFDLDFTVPEDGEIRMFVRPVGTLVETVYSHMQIIINMEHPA